MPNTFMGIETLSRGLWAQQLNMNVQASNLAKSYRDEYGYVVTSRQRLDLSTNTPFLLGTPTGVHSLGTGPQVQKITRLRSLYLDIQIQKQSQVVGRNEILAEVLNQIQGILAGSQSIDDSMAELAGAFAALSADPLDIALRDDVVNAGKDFADLSREQFFELERLQLGVNNDVIQTVSDVNQLLRELHSINRQLVNSTASNNNDLLDARDYALTRLSRLLNVQASFDSKGIANVFLGGLTLVNSAGHATFDTSPINDHNVPLNDVRFQSIAGFTMDVTDQISGGRLGGQLQARDVVLDFYKSSLDQCVHSLMDTVNVMHRAGYAADGTTTNIDFFTGVSARDININATMWADPTRALLSASSRYGDTANGQMAQFISNVGNLQADDFMRSQPRVRNFFGAIDPTQALNSAIPTALNLSATNANGTNWATPFLAGGGTFTVNSVNVTYAAGDTLYEVIDAINAADPNVQAFFNYTEQRIYILANNTTTIGAVTAGAQGFTMLNNFMTSTIRMNNGFSPQDLKIDPAQAFDSATNLQAFKVTVGTEFSFRLNGTVYSFTDDQSLNNVLSTINSATLGAVFNPQTQEIWLNSAVPIQLRDVNGNFTAFTGLNGSKRIGELTSSLDDKILSQYAAVDREYRQSVDALNQLNNTQAATAAIAFDSTEAGVPYEMEMANSVKALVAFNASLQVMHLMDKMLSDLVSILGGASSSTFTQRS